MDQNRMSRDEYLFYMALIATYRNARYKEHDAIIQASATFLEKWTEFATLNSIELRGKQPFEVKAHTVTPFEYFKHLKETTPRPPRKGIFS